jgi:hypothetical protein
MAAARSPARDALLVGSRELRRCNSIGLELAHDGDVEPAFSRVSVACGTATSLTCPSDSPRPKRAVRSEEDR